MEKAKTKVTSNTKKQDTAKEKVVDKAKEKAKEKINKETRFSLITVIVLVVLAFIPSCIVGINMAFKPFRNANFAENIFTKDQMLGNIDVYIGSSEDGVEINEMSLEDVEEAEVLKKLSNMYVKQKSFMQIQNKDIGYSADHVYVKLKNTATGDLIKIRMEGIAMQVSDYDYIIDDSLKSADLILYINNMLNKQAEKVEI